MTPNSSHTDPDSVLELQIPDTEFIVCDVETTGLSSHKNRLTEIALMRVVNGAIVDKYESLINPHQFISVDIQRLTGISNEMVYTAPEAEQVLEEAVRFIGNGVFVAHNAKFDRSFVDVSLERVGMEPLAVPTICTARLANRLVPKRRSTSLGRLARNMGIRISNRHRAGGDAEATAQIFIRFLEILREEFHFTEAGDVVSFQHKPVYRITSPPKNVLKLKDRLAELPHSSGVYFYHDKHGNIIYIGKAKDLHDRVNSYFYHNIGHTEKVRRLVRAVHSIAWKTTETELSALLLESQSIKQHQPRFNTMLKRYRKYAFIKIDVQDEFPTVHWSYDIENDGAEYYGPFSSRFAVEDAIDSINKLFLLRECEGTIHPDVNLSPCLYYDIKRCSAPCAEVVTKDEYFQDVETLTLFLQGEHDELLGRFHQKMEKKSEELKFEEAAMIRDRMAALERIIRQQRVMARSVRKQNLVIITLARRTYVEVHLIKSGMLAKQFLVDQKNVHQQELHVALTEVFFSKQEEIFGNRKEDINEMRIIASWCLTRRGDSKVIEVDAFRGIKSFLNRVVSEIQQAGKEKSEKVLLKQASG